MNITWLSANRLGYDLLKETQSLDDPEINVSRLITLSPNSKTVMYDDVHFRDWYDLGIKTNFVNRIEETGQQILESERPDIVITAGWRQMIPSELLEIPKYGFVSFHPSLLPYGRGPAPIINQLLSGRKGSGLTFFHTSEGVDSGDIIGQVAFSLNENDHASEFYQKMTEAGKTLIQTHLPALARGIAPRLPQGPKITYFGKLANVNKIGVADPIDEIHKKVKAVSRPYKGAYLKDNSGNKLRVWRAKRTEELPEDATLVPVCSSLESIVNKDNLFFTDGKNHLQLTEMELELR